MAHKLNQRSKVGKPEPFVAGKVGQAARSYAATVDRRRARMTPYAEPFAIMQFTGGFAWLISGKDGLAPFANPFAPLWTVWQLEGQPQYLAPEDQVAVLAFVDHDAAVLAGFRHDGLPVQTESEILLQWSLERGVPIMVVNRDGDESLIMTVAALPAQWEQPSLLDQGTQSDGAYDSSTDPDLEHGRGSL